MSNPDPLVLIERVRGVLPALNLSPAGDLKLTPDIVERMRERQKLTMLLDHKHPLVYVGTRTSDPDRAAPDAARTALELLPREIQDQCEGLIVVWDDASGDPFAAAFTTEEGGGVGDLLGASWIHPTTWPLAMFDLSVSPDSALDMALSDVRRAVLAEPTDPVDGEALTRAIRVVDLLLTHDGGEGQGSTPGIVDERDPERRDIWFRRYENSIRDEWNRVNDRLGATRLRAALTTSTGPLFGTRVFLSYARPDATELARPVVDGLRAHGADVWFDQEEELAEGWLDDGLAATIRSCDAYVLCASDEFFERAGYATQELAWAVQQLQPDEGLRGLVVVRFPGTLLPRVIDGWPVLDFSAGQDIQSLGSWIERAIQDALMMPNPSRPPLAGVSEFRGTTRSDAVIDGDDLLLRVRHLERVLEIPSADLEAIVRSHERNSRTSRIAALIRDIGRGLDWDGHLNNHEAWPSDPLTRSARWMLGSMRTIATMPWPLSGSFDDRDDIDRDLSILLRQLPPVFSWPDSPGWDDTERRYLLRHHLGVLRVAKQLVHHERLFGLTTDRMWAPEHWEQQLDLRRQECIDALVEMRIAGQLSWRGEPIVWESLYDSWFKALAAPIFASGLPVEVWRQINGSRRTIAALCAQTAWIGVRAPARFVEQRCLIGGEDEPMVCTSWLGNERTATDTPGSWLSIGLVETDGAIGVRLRWSLADGFGQTTLPAPDVLAHPAKLSRTPFSA